jgi:integrase/recombinase XerC
MIESFLKYIQYEKRVSPNTILAYQNDLLQFQNFINENFPDDKIESASYSLIRAWIVNLVELKLTPISVNRKIATLRTYYKYLLRQEVISKDPMTKIRILKTKKKLPGFVKESEMSTTRSQKPNDQSFRQKK